MKGRGYTVYGSLESWVGTGVNSVSGGNRGIVTIDFSNGLKAQNRVKFVFPPFELKGFLFGKRTFKTQGQALFLDERDRLLLELNISQHKGLT